MQRVQAAVPERAVDESSEVAVVPSGGEAARLLDGKDLEQQSDPPKSQDGRARQVLTAIVVCICIAVVAFFAVNDWVRRQPFLTRVNFKTV